jgi:hypothetical protein
MSGRKCSEFRLQRERERRLELVQSITGLHTEIGALQERIETMLREASAGLHATFAQEVREARRWLDRPKVPSIKGLGMETSSDTLKATHRDLEQIASRARRIRETLAVSFTQKADEMGQHLAHQLAEAERDYIGSGQLLQVWLGQDQVQEWECRFQQARQMLDEEQYSSLESLLNTTVQEIAGGTRGAKKQEEKHQKRLYLLKALRQVCAEMAFQEVSGPRYEHPGNRASNIIFIIDTLDRGRIKFTLSLEQISSFSEIADERCFEQFDTLSQYLQDQYGIETKFRWEDGTRPPKGDVDDARPEPTSIPATTRHDAQRGA